MKWNITILPANEFVPQEIVEEEIPEKYLFDEMDELTCTSTIFYEEKTVSQLINFLFRNNTAVTEVYRVNENYLLDLSALKDRLLTFKELEELYPKWLEETGRENSMNEFGMLVDFIGHAKKGVRKKYLLMIVCCQK